MILFIIIKCLFKTNKKSDCDEYQITRNVGLIIGRTEVNGTLKELVAD